MEDINNKKKLIRSNAAQVRFLLQYMNKHHGEFRGPLGSVNNDDKWRRLKSALDKLGPTRSIKQWKLCWRDQKKKARKAERSKTNDIWGQTGDSDDVPEGPEIILETVGDTMTFDTGPTESTIGDSDDPQASDSKAQELASCSQSPIPVEFADYASPTSVDFSTAAAQGPIHHQQNAARRKRRRRATPPELFLKAQLEQNRLLKELVDIIENVGSELVYALKEANAIHREKLELNK